VRQGLVAVCISLFLSFAALAQTDRGSITGTITDSTGAVVANAPVEVANQATGAIYRGGASATGNFIVANLPAGQYSLTVTVNGFKKYVRQNLEVAVATDTRADVNLEVGNTAESVTVTESAPILKSESGEISHTITPGDATQLPLFTIGTLGLGNGLRDPLQMATLLPGVSYSQDTVLQINGLPSGTEAIRIEGQDAKNNLFSQWTSLTQAGTDAIQEVSVQTSNFAPEYGQAGGGYFNFTMKSGTNQYHGSAYNYMRNEALNAGNPYTDRCVTNSLQCGQHVRPRIRENDWGATIGGPISIPKVYDGKNRSFFFFNVEQFLLNTETTGTLLTAPTANYQAGNFGAPFVNSLGVTTALGTTPTCVVISAACPAIGGPTYATQGGVLAKDGLGRTIPEYGVYDPATARPSPTGVVNDLFPNGIIPPGRMDPVALKIQGLLPQPTNTNLINNYAVPNYSNPNHTINWSTKIDQSLSPTMKISGYYSQVHETNPNYNGLNLGGSVGASNAITGVQPINTTSHTVRVNYDQTLRPTLLLHFGAGYLHSYYPYATTDSSILPASALGFYNNNFPNITGLSNTSTGGNSVGLGSGAAFGKEYEEKTTGNTSLTWVKRNHTFKFGGELGIDGIITQSTFHVNGNINFSANETSDQWQGAQSTALVGGSGFGYASFLLGMVDNFQVAPTGTIKLGNHAIGLYAQDSWKATRKLTIDYGLRYDYQTYLTEQYGRMLNADLNQPNPNVGGYLGTVIYEGSGPGHCNCAFSHNYPWAFGPRLGAAYQINRKTVLRGGAGIQYGTTSANSQLSLNVVAFYNFGAPGYGIPALPSFASGNPYRAGNPYGNTPLTFPNLDPYQYPGRSICPGTANGTCYAPQTPFLTFDKDSRPPRIFTYSFGLQRELNRNIVVEAEYVGNRGVWFTAPGLDILPANALNITDLARFGLNINNANDRALLASTLNSPIAIQRGFGTPPYPGFPVTQTVEQSLRPHPQWGAVPPFLGPPMGNTWYDSLQTKVTRRFSHGLSAQGSYTYSKALERGVNNDSQYATGGIGSLPSVSDIYNIGLNKGLSAYNRPNQLVFSGTYIVPKPTFGVLQNKFISQIVKDWQMGAVLRYQSGALIGVPTSLNGIENNLDRGFAQGNGAGPFGTTTWNLNSGQPLFLVDPNGHFDPTKQLVLNPAAWTDAPAGTFGTSAFYYNNFRWQRQPSEAMNFARNFRMGKEGKYILNVRIDFQNVFNRHFYSMPNTLYPSTPQANLNAFYQGGPPAGALSGGYGYVSFLNGLGDTPRSGQFVARFQF
jgi:hypothetical protein